MNKTVKKALKNAVILLAAFWLGITVATVKNSYQVHHLVQQLEAVKARNVEQQRSIWLYMDRTGVRPDGSSLYND